jgi:hypothetical protein
MRNKQMIVKVLQHCNDGGFKLCPTDAENHQWDIYNQSNWYNFQLIAGPKLQVVRKKDGATTTLATTASNLSDLPYWMRVRVDSSKIYFDYAVQTGTPVEGDWTNLTSENWNIGTGIDQTQYIYLTSYNTPTTGSSYWNYFVLRYYPDPLEAYIHDSSEITDTTYIDNSALEIGIHDTTDTTDHTSISTVTESVNINVYDNISTTDTPDIETSGLMLSVYETSTVSDASVSTIPTLLVSTQDNVSVADAGSVIIPIVHVSVHDSSEVSDEISMDLEITLLFIYTYSTSGATDDISTGIIEEINLIVLNFVDSPIRLS